MTHRRWIPALFIVAILAACGGDPPPPPAPEGPSQEELERMRADSIAAARAEAEARRRAEEAAERERRMREAALAEARETLTQAVYFDFDESTITPATEAILRNKVEVLRASPNVRLRIEGHADERGSTEYNMALGARRAEAVRQFFTGFGLAAARFETISYGEERPAVNASNEAAWEQNRRAEFVITAGADQINVSSMDDDR